MLNGNVCQRRVAAEISLHYSKNSQIAVLPLLWLNQRHKIPPNRFYTNKLVCATWMFKVSRASVWVDTSIRSNVWKTPTKMPPSPSHRTACQCFSHVWLSAVWIERHPRTDKQRLVFSVIVTSRLAWSHVWPSFVLSNRLLERFYHWHDCKCTCLPGRVVSVKPVQMK